jgi:outer membrane protein OmpA-like peptidoglycan-associated protein
VFNPINLGDSINSSRNEYLPTLTVDDSLLVYSRRNKGGGEDFYRSKMIDPIHFTKAERIPGDLNMETFKGAITVSEDGDWMIFAGDLEGKTYGSYDLYISYYTPNGWSEPENLGPNINSESWESTPCLSPDNRALYFSSKREGGYGGADLYVSYRDVRGKWGPAINLGPTINTRGNEQTPFIHADNQTMYYTSDGLQGYGGDDLFIVRKDSTDHWGKPENLGYPINTIENDGSMIVAPNGIDAYYASDRSDTYGDLDLYHFELRNDIRPYKTIFVKGIVYDNKTKKGLPSNVELIDNRSGKPLMLVQTDETGYYFISLPTGRDFTFNVNRKGYFFFSKNYSLNDKIPDSTYHLNIYLTPIEVNAVIVLKNIQFEFNGYKLLESSKVELDRVVQILNENPTLKININGHTDNIGGNASNLLLSANRAKAVIDYIIEKGIERNRLQSKGFGASKPIATNDTEDGRAINRRTELVVVSY